MKVKYLALVLAILSVLTVSVEAVVPGSITNTIRQDVNKAAADEDKKTETEQRKYCKSFNSSLEPVLLYDADPKTGKLKLKDRKCKTNTYSIKGKVCKKGVKLINIQYAKCQVCIEEFDLDIKNIVKNQASKGPTPGVECKIKPGYMPSGDKTPIPGYKPKAPKDFNKPATTGGSAQPNATTSAGSSGGQGDLSQMMKSLTQQPQQQGGSANCQRFLNQNQGNQSILGSLTSMWTGNQAYKQCKSAERNSQRQNTRTKPKPECKVFSASSSTIRPGESTTLQWSLAYSRSAYISPRIGRVDPRGGTIKVSPRETTTYILQMDNENGYAKCSAITISVAGAEVAGTYDNDTYQQDLVQSTSTIKCSPSRVDNGGIGIVLWQCPKGSTESTGSSTELPEFSTKGKTSGSARVRLGVTSTFVVRCKDSLNKELARNSCKIEVRDGNANVQGDGTPLARIAANKNEVAGGETVTISWRGYNTDNCTITGPDGFKEYGNKGSVTGRMLQTSTFRLSCIADKKDLPIKEITVTVI